MSIEGKKFCIIGQLDSQPRDEVEFGLYDIGGDPVKTISKSVDFVIAGKDPGKRLEEAKELGIPILDEGDIGALFEGKSVEEILASK